MNKYVLTDDAKEKIEKLANLDYKKIIAYFAAFCGYSFGIKVAASVLKNWKKLGFFSLIGGSIFSMYMGNQLGVFIFKCFEAAEKADEASKESKDGGNENKA